MEFMMALIYILRKCKSQKKLATIVDDRICCMEVIVDWKEAVTYTLWSQRSYQPVIVVYATNHELKC